MGNMICKIFHRLSWPRQDEEGYYQVCLVEGRRLPWRDPMPLPSPYRQEHAQRVCLLTFRTQEAELEPVQRPHDRRAIAKA